MPKQTFFNLPEEKRNHIIEVSIDEFAKAPYQNISINHLIKSMNIPTGSFYQYFEDKKDLYFYILSFYIDGILEESNEGDFICAAEFATTENINFMLSASYHRRTSPIFYVPTL